MDLAPLFTRLEQLAPQFGRAGHDLLALVARGRSGDVKGALQNARLVLGAVQAHLEQPASAGAVPDAVLAHMATVQASNDQEVGASLSALVAVLNWYAETYAPSAPVVVTPPPPDKKTNPLVMAMAIAIPVVGGLYALWIVATAGPSAVEVANAGVALNAFYKANKEPPPTGHCRMSDTRTLIKVSHSPGSLSILQGVAVEHPEVSYLRARALAEAKQPAEAELEKALACEGFAAAHGLKARLLGQDDKKDEAAAELEKALAAEPDWSTGHYDLALVELSRGRIKEGADQLKLYVEAEPDDGDGWLMLGAAYEGWARKLGDGTGEIGASAKAAFCEAEKRGKAEAKSRCSGP